MTVNKQSSVDYELKRYILTRIPLARKTDTVKSVLAMLEKESKTFESIEYIYIVNSKGALEGSLSIKELFSNEKNATLEQLMKTNLITVPFTMEIERIAHIALQHDLKAIPVIKSEKFIGVIPSRKIISIVNKALKEDIFHFAGIHKSHLEFEHSLEAPLGRIIKDRLLWLIIGLLGALVIAAYVGFFEKTLEKYLILAAFVPAIVYMSDALGTQIQTVFIRDLAIMGKGLPLKHYFYKQFAIAGLMAMIIAAIMFIGIWLFWQTPFIAFVISLSTFISLLVTSLTALFITILIKRFKFDPALGSGPIATIISDLTSIIIYFIVAVLLLHV